MAHTLSMECVSLSINLLLSYHFASCWIPSVLRHKEPELQQVLRPGVRSQRQWVQVPIRVLAGFESQSVGSSPNLKCAVSAGEPWRDSDKVGECSESGLGPKWACGTPGARCTGEDAPPMSAHFWWAGQPHMLNAGPGQNCCRRIW